MLKNIIDDWEKNQKDYLELCEYIKKDLYSILNEEGFFVKVVYRIKDPVHLSQKLINDRLENKKNGIEKSFEELYATLSDKAGLRIICRYSDEVPPIIKIVKNHFLIVKEDNKITHLNYNEMGYKSYHLDIKLKEENTPSAIFHQVGPLMAEIQVRTLCENVWAEIDHDIGYKPSSDIAYTVRRQIHCLGGLLEVADDSLSRINEELTNAAAIDESYLLKKIEPIFVKQFKMDYNHEFSLQTLKILKSLIHFSSPKEFEKEFSKFLESNREMIQFFSEHYTAEKTYNPYVSQPECLLIFYLLKKNKHELVDHWQAELFIEDLEKMGELWGVPIADMLGE